MPALPTSHSRDRTALLLLGGLVLALFPEAWLPGRTLFARDLTYVFHPMHVWTAENIQAGRLPHWNPFVAGGVPWMADPQTGLLYPGNLFFLFFPFAAGLKGFLVLHSLLTALGAWLLVRKNGGSRAWALAVALLWAGNGFWRSRMEFPPLLATIAWLPWMALAARSFRLAAPVFLLGGLGGHAPHFAWSAGLASLWALSGKLPRRRMAALVLGGAAAALLAFPQLFWTVRGMGLSQRFTEGIGLAQAVIHRLSPSDLWAIVTPWAGALKDQVYTGEKYFWLGTFYLGAAGMALAVLAFLDVDRRRRLFWGGVFVLGALLCLGDLTPLYGFLHRHAVFFRWIRYPAQFSFWMVGAALCVMAAARPSRPRWLLAAGGAVAIELFLYGFRAVPTLPPSYFHERPAWAVPLQGADAGTLFLSPAAVSDLQGSGRTPYEGWVSLRLKLLGLAPAPYHVRALNPVGFAFIPRETAADLDRLYAAPDVKSAEPLLDRFGVRWVAAPKALNDPGLTLRADPPPWHLYERRPPRAPVPVQGGAPAGWPAAVLGGVLAWSAAATGALARLKKLI